MLTRSAESPQPPPPPSTVAELLRQNPTDPGLWARAHSEWANAQPVPAATCGAEGIPKLLANSRPGVSAECIVGGLRAIGQVAPDFYLNIANKAAALRLRDMAIDVLNMGLTYWPANPILTARLIEVTRPPSAPPPAGAVPVKATNGWVDSGVILSTGMTLTITAEGSVHPCVQDNCTDKRYQNWIGPEGFVILPRQQPNSFPDMALIGRIGDAGPFYIGRQQTLTASTSGGLWLYVNDWQDSQSDNAGGFDVVVQVSQPPDPISERVGTAAPAGRLRIEALYPASYRIVGQGLDMRRNLTDSSPLDLPLPVGRYQIVVSSEQAFLPERELPAITIEENRTHVASMPIRVPVFLYGTPAADRILVDGHEVQNRSDTNIAVGRHTLRYIWADGRSRDVPVTISESVSISMGPTWPGPQLMKR